MKRRREDGRGLLPTPRPQATSSTRKRHRGKRQRAGPQVASLPPRQGEIFTIILIMRTLCVRAKSKCSTFAKERYHTLPQREQAGSVATGKSEARLPLENNVLRARRPGHGSRASRAFRIGTVGGFSDDRRNAVGMRNRVPAPERIATARRPGPLVSNGATIGQPGPVLFLEPSAAGTSWTRNRPTIRPGSAAFCPNFAQVPGSRHISPCLDFYQTLMSERKSAANQSAWV